MSRYATTPKWFVYDLSAAVEPDCQQFKVMAADLPSACVEIVERHKCKPCDILMVANELHVEMVLRPSDWQDVTPP